MTEEAKPRKRFTGRTKPSDGGTRSQNSSAVPVNQIPAAILNDDPLNRAIAALLPSNYSFEVHKTIWQIKKYAIQRVALQMPEGLSMWSCALVDLVEQFTEAEAIVLGDVTYGACCVDDYTARALGCDMLVHYGHSCLIPIDSTTIRTLYVFVEITIDTSHLAQAVRYNFPECLEDEDLHQAVLDMPALSITSPSSHLIPETKIDEPFRIACVGTVQFLAAVQSLGTNLAQLETAPQRLAIASSDITGATSETPARRTIEIIVPQIKPLSPGEVLGCTAPPLPSNTDAILYVGDGRFHLESIMIANPTVPAFRYDPYEKKLTSEGYQHEEMRKMRAEAIESGKVSLKAKEEDEGTWGVVLGTLGRQGSLPVLQSVMENLPPSRSIPILLSELSPAKLSLLAPHISLFVQTSCPRLSIDWGYAFPRPLLTPYEANIALGKAVDFRKDTRYRMDFWSDESEGPWTPRFETAQKERERKKEREERSRMRAALKLQEAVTAAWVGRKELETLSLSLLY